MSQNKPLTARQELFCIQYCANDLNGAKAARLAGYAEDSCNVKAAQLLAKVNIQERIAELMAKTVAKSTKGAEDVYNMAANAAFLDVGEILDMDSDGVYLKDGVTFQEIPKDVRVLIQALKERRTKFGVTVEIVFVDKLKALEMLARFNGMNKDKIEVTNEAKNLSDEEIRAQLKEALGRGFNVGADRGCDSKPEQG